MAHYNLQSDLGSIPIVDFHGQPAIGGAVLVATCEMRWHYATPERRPQVMVTGGVLKVVGEMGNRDLGFAHVDPPCLLEPSQKNPHPRFALSLPCSRAFVRELNALRASKEMRLSASVVGWVLLTNVDPIPEDPRESIVFAPPPEPRRPMGTEDERRPLGTKRLYSFQAMTEELRVDPTKWQEVLAQCGFMRSMMFEVPLPDRGDASGLGGVSAALERTVALHRQGDFLSKEAVASLREVLDELLQWRPDLKMTDPEAKEYVANYSKNGGASHDVRVRHLLWSIRRLSDLAHHGKPIWTRHDAEYVITTLAALVRRLVEDLPLRSVVP